MFIIHSEDYRLATLRKAENIKKQEQLFIKTSMLAKTLFHMEKSGNLKGTEREGWMSE